MNPYLEVAAWWPAIHHRLISAIDDQLRETLPPLFFSTIEERVYLSLPETMISPDVLLIERHRDGRQGNVQTAVRTPVDGYFTVELEKVRERFIEVRKADNEEVVAAIEVLSPINKSREAYGRDSYLRKRDKLIDSSVHLLEIDLLRGGLHTVAVPHEKVNEYAGDDWQYIACLHRVTHYPAFDFWPVALRSRLPIVAVPLTPAYDDVTLDLQRCVNTAYEGGSFARRIDYTKEPALPLSPDDAAWADALLKEQKLR